jgi:hypothetical protein
MMPQLGVMAKIEKEDLAQDARAAAIEVFEKDCLIHLGTCVAPVGTTKPGTTVLHAELTLLNGETQTHEIKFGDIVRIDVPYEKVNAKLTPGKGMDIGSGKNETIQTIIYGGVVGIILDGRGRPMNISDNSQQRIADLSKWSAAMQEYPSLEGLG